MKQEIDQLMLKIMSALPNTNGRRPVVRAVCLSVNEHGWLALAGGHQFVHIGEYGGDFQGEGATAEEALTNCLKAVEHHD